MSPVNPFKTNELAQHYQLGASSVVLRASGVILF